MVIHANFWQNHKRSTMNWLNKTYYYWIAVRGHFLIEDTGREDKKGKKLEKQKWYERLCSKSCNFGAFYIGIKNTVNTKLKSLK